MRFIVLLFFAFLVVGSSIGWSQIDTTHRSKELSLSQFLFQVGTKNMGYIAEQYQVSIADAGIESAKIFPDPQLTLGGYDNQENKLRLGRGYSVSVGGVIELGGKRRSRIELAQSQAEWSKAMLLDYFRNLRANAALSYFRSIQQYERLRVLARSYTTMSQLAQADSIRFRLGSITEIDARQSRLEAAGQLNEVLQSEADWKMSLKSLDFLSGASVSDTLVFPTGNFDGLQRQYTLTALIDSAVSTRADAVAALLATKVTSKNLQLAQANRRPDLGITAGLTMAGEATNDIAPTPGYKSAAVGVSIPLKLSNRYKGELKAAQYAQRQAEIVKSQVEFQIRTEVEQAFINYESARKQATHYQSGILGEAAKVLDGKIYSYKRGETSLLEVLNAQRTYNEVQTGYFQALFNLSATLIELQRSAGVWDIK